jgi:queuine tRNA-ribosyltransferase
MRIQRVLDSDIVMVFDECTPYPATTEGRRRLDAAVLRWAERSPRAPRAAANALFGIVQGGMYEALRDESLAGLLGPSASTATRSAGCRSASRRRT